MAQNYGINSGFFELIKYIEALLKINADIESYSVDEVMICSLIIHIYGFVLKQNQSVTYASTALVNKERDQDNRSLG